MIDEEIVAVTETAAIEREIDELIFDLYGLTPEERETVRGGGQ